MELDDILRHGQSLPLQEAIEACRQAVKSLHPETSQFRYGCIKCLVSALVCLFLVIILPLTFFHRASVNAHSAMLFLSSSTR